jgi:hypothetical protein
VLALLPLVGCSLQYLSERKRKRERVHHGPDTNVMLRFCSRHVHYRLLQII